MATVTKQWENGDLLTLVTSAGGIAVSSAENLTGADREMTIRVQTTNQGTKAFQDVLIKQNKVSVIQDGYWVHKDTAVKTYFGADSDFINNGVMGRPDWLFDAVEIKLCSGINDFELTGVEVEGQTIYVCLVFIDVNFETGEGGNDVLQNIDMSNTLVNTIGLSTFYSCTSLTSITLPDSLTSIGGNAFASCTSLTSITLPDSLTSIGSGAFANCTSLMLVTSLPTIPPSLSQLVFFNTHADLIIKVPAQSVNTYKTATNWKSYASKISAI